MYTSRRLGRRGFQAILKNPWQNKNSQRISDDPSYSFWLVVFVNPLRYRIQPGPFSTHHFFKRNYILLARRPFPVWI